MKPSKLTATRFPAKLYRQIAKAAADDSRTVSEWLRQAAKEKLARQDTLP